MLVEPKPKVDDLMLLQYHMYICRAYRSVHEVGWLFDGDLFHHLWVAYHQNRSVPNVEPGVVYNEAYIHV